MELSAVLDPMFHLALADGLLLATVLPLLGAALMLRDEWLAALGFANLAAAGALLGLSLGAPAVAGAVIIAAAGAGAKAALGATGNATYGLMILGGWAALMLIGANSELGEQLGHALVDGQLYFAGLADLIAAVLLVGLLMLMLPRLMPSLLRERLLPRSDGEDPGSTRRRHLAFDLLTATAVAVATASMGLMAAFALVLVPAWLAFRVAPNWRWTLMLSAAFGLCGYLIAFGAALALDQPFGPVLVAMLLVLALVATLLERAVVSVRRRRHDARLEPFGSLPRPLDTGDRTQ